jgi:hypothetical protein
MTALGIQLLDSQVIDAASIHTIFFQVITCWHLLACLDPLSVLWIPICPLSATLFQQMIFSCYNLYLDVLAVLNIGARRLRMA